MTQGERVKAVRKAVGLNGTDFGAKLGVGNTAISKIEKGVVALTDSMAKLICREFKVSLDWLRDGSGEMFVIMTPAEQIAAYAADTLGLPLDHPRVRWMRFASGLPDEAIAMIIGTVDRLYEEEQAEAAEAEEGK